MRGKSRLLYFLLTLPAALLFLVFFIYPFFTGFVYSLQDWDGISQNSNFVGLQNYISLFTDPRIGNTISFTVQYTVVLVIGTLLLGMAAALLLDRLPRGKGFFRTMYFLPAVLSSVTVGLIWNQLFTNALPQIGKMMGSELFSKNVLGNVQLAFWALLLTTLWQGLATPTLLFLSSLQNVPRDLLESAALDGASPWQTFLHIKAPFLIPSISIVVILTVKGGLTAFDNIFALTGGGPARSTESVGLLIYSYAFKEYKSSYASALAVAVFLVVGIISLVQIKSSQRFEVEQ